MKRVASIAAHVTSPAAAEAEVEVEDQDAALGSFEQEEFPIFGADTPVDDAFVQRFLTEGFCTLTPDMAPGIVEKIDARLKEMTPPVVSSEEEGEALEKKVIAGAERGYLVMDSDGSVKSADGKRTSEYDNSSKDEPVLPELDDLLEAPNVKATLTALLGENYMVDSDRGSNFTVPGRKANTDWHRDGNDKRRHHHPRMLMGLYYPQAVTLRMGPTAVVARSHWLSDFDPAFQNHEVLSTPRQSTAGVNNDGDYLGTGRGGANNPMSVVPEHFGVTRYMAVPAGTFMIMFYDTWHRATSSTNESDMHLTPVDRDPTDTRWMCKFRFWRMEEPSRPTWLHDPDRAFEPPLDSPFPDEYRITPATKSVFNWMTGHQVQPAPDGEAAAVSTADLMERLGWFSPTWSIELKEQFRRGVPPPNPLLTETGKPASLGAMCAAYELATRPEAWAPMLTATLCGGVTISPDRAVGAWAAYTASYGLASVVPTPEALVRW